MLDVRNVSVSFGTHKIVEDVSLRVLRGQFVGLIGPNGCGKSTLLKSIYKVLRPESGAVLLEGKDLLAMPPKKAARTMGVVGQFNDMSFDFSVYEMVMMGRTPHKGLMEGDSRQDHEIVREALERVKMTEFKDRKYRSLSGGEKQRVILARAIAQQPQCLILDEPTNHLDIKYQLQILETVSGMGIGLLAALHDLQLAAEYCDVLYAMKAGRVVAHGEPQEIITKKLIRELYDIDCETFINPVTGKWGIAYLAG